MTFDLKYDFDFKLVMYSKLYALFFRTSRFFPDFSFHGMRKNYEKSQIPYPVNVATTLFQRCFYVVCPRGSYIAMQPEWTNLFSY